MFFAIHARLVQDKRKNKQKTRAVASVKFYKYAKQALKAYAKV